MTLDGGPSQTARRVAAHRLSFTRPAPDYGDPRAEDALAADVADGLTAADAGGGVAKAASRMRDYLAARTAFFDRAVLDAIEAGTRQIVVGAAGYDGRALRYAKPGVRWFEVDHPATQRDKLARLARLGIDAGHVTFIAADFTEDDTARLLTQAGLDSAAPSLFLVEGVAVYLDAEVLETLLSQFRAVAGDGSQLVISMPTGGISRDSVRFREAVAALGEPVRSRFTPDEAAALLATAGWRISIGASGLMLATADHGTR
jgi:methyltransferase (TIGR00027 family)